LSKNVKWLAIPQNYLKIAISPTLENGFSTKIREYLQKKVEDVKNWFSKKVLKGIAIS
jgi:hypothetical protein